LESERAAVAQEIADLKTRINGATADNRLAPRTTEETKAQNDSRRPPSDLGSDEGAMGGEEESGEKLSRHSPTHE
jgi:hypothetical protein